MCYVFTAGYQGKSIDEFLQLMQNNHIECVLDIREVPISRKKGFSKRSFSEGLSQYGIEYIHIKGLGSPKEIRDVLHRTHDYQTFFDAYRNYIGLNFAYIQEAWEYVQRKRTCLVCFEKDNKECHRSVVADIIYHRMPNIDGVINL